MGSEPVESDTAERERDHDLLVEELERESSGRQVPLWRKILGISFSLVVVVVVFGVVLPGIADYGEVMQAIADMTGIELGGIAAIGLLNLASYQPALMAALPGLRFGQAFQVSQASTAFSNTVPAGAAVGVGLSAAMYRSWGFERRSIARALLLGGIWNIFMKLGLPIVAVALLVLSGSPGGGLVAAAAIGIATLLGAVAVFAAILRSERAAFRIGEAGSNLVSWLRARIGRDPIGGFGHTLVKFRRETIDLLRDRWLVLTAATVLSHLSLYAVLLVALRDVGVSQDEVSWQQVLATFTFVRLLSALPITPGGVGVVELGMTAGMVAAGGNEVDVVAAVLVYRAITYVVPIALGALCYPYWRRQVARGTANPRAAAVTARR